MINCECFQTLSCFPSHMKYFCPHISVWIEVRCHVRHGSLFVTAINYEPIVTIVLTYHTFQFYSKCFYHYFELQSNHLLKQKTNYIFQVSTRKEVYDWKERIETSTPTIYDINRYTIADQLGKGAFGVVRRAHDTFVEVDVAVKILPDAYDNRTQLKNAIRELRILQAVNHPNIVKFYDVYLSEETLYLVTELCQRDMLRLLQNHYTSITQEDVISITKQLLSAIKHLHELGIMHRDIKPSNVLICVDKTIKLCDFGMARTRSLAERERAYSTTLDFEGYDYSSTSSTNYYQSSRRTSHSTSSVATTRTSQYSEYVVTRWYRAPEVLLSSGHYGLAQDVWAAGCTLAELLLRRPLFPGSSKKDQVERIFRVFGYRHNTDFITTTVGMRTYLTLQQENSPTGVGLAEAISNKLMDGRTFDLYLDLLGEMLQVHPSNRVSCRVALKHQLFASSPMLSQTPTEYSHRSLILSDVDEVASNRRSLIRLLHEEIQRFKLRNDPSLQRRISRTTELTEIGSSSYSRGSDNESYAADFYHGNNGASQHRIIAVHDDDNAHTGIDQRIDTQTIGIAMSAALQEEFGDSSMRQRVAPSYTKDRFNSGQAQYDRSKREALCRFKSLQPHIQEEVGFLLDADVEFNVRYVDIMTPMNDDCIAFPCCCGW